jgi:hypothetical protein
MAAAAVLQAWGMARPNVAKPSGPGGAFVGLNSPASASRQVCVGGGPEYQLDRKLGKGGFGQVFVGRRVQPTKSKDGPNANLVSGGS